MNRVSENLCEEIRNENYRTDQLSVSIYRFMRRVLLIFDMKLFQVKMTNSCYNFRSRIWVHFCY